MSPPSFGSAMVLHPSGPVGGHFLTPLDIYSLAPPAIISSLAPPLTLRSLLPAPQSLPKPPPSLLFWTYVKAKDTTFRSRVLSQWITFWFEFELVFHTFFFSLLDFYQGPL